MDFKSVRDNYLNYLISLKNNEWTLFLDRDGTINKRIVNGYVIEWRQFEWEEGALKALKTFSRYFKKIILVTNQQGIGKGLMTTDDLNKIHKSMLVQIKKCGGRIDKIYFCPKLESDHLNCRKPKVTMGLWAKRDFPDIDFTKSTMIGDSESDIVFGKSLGMKTIALGRSISESDFQKDNLISFADDLEKESNLSTY